MRERQTWLGRLWLATATMPPRLAYAGGAIGLQALEDITRAWSQRFLGDAVAALLSLVLMTLSLIGLCLAVSPRLPSLLTRRAETTLMRVVALCCLALAIGGVGEVVYIGFECFQPPVYYNDGALLDENAARLLLRGENPYAQSDIVAAARAAHQPAQYTTPLQRGKLAHATSYPDAAELDRLLAEEPVGHPNQVQEFETHVSYPALAFLVLVPLVWANVPTTPLFYLACLLVFAAVGFRAARRDWRWWVALLFAADLPVISAALGGGIDILCALLVVFAWLHYRRWWLSALLMGLALATKQTAWLSLPFYLIFVYQYRGVWDAARRMGVASALFLVINLPFIALDRGAWLAGVLAPVRDPMFPLGAGLIALAIAHLTPFLPRGAYVVLEVIGMAAALTWYWRWARVRPEAAMVLATLPLVFAWRSLPSYFQFSALPAVIVLASVWGAGAHPLDPSRRLRARKWREGRARLSLRQRRVSPVTAADWSAMTSSRSTTPQTPLGDMLPTKRDLDCEVHRWRTKPWPPGRNWSPTLAP